MRKFLLGLVLFLFTGSVFGQITRSAPVYRGKRSSDPATCNVSIPTWYFDTVSNTFKYCSATNTWSSMGGGATSVGDEITGLTSGSVLFGGTSGVLAQNNSRFFYDDSNHTLRLGDSTGGSYDYPLALLGPGGFSFAGTSNVVGWMRSGYSGIDIGGYKTVSFTDQSNTHATFSFNQDSSTNPTFTLNSVVATKPALLLQLAASQSANAMEVKDSSGNVAFYIHSDPATYGIGFGTPGGGNGVRTLPGAGTQLVSNFNATVQGSLYGQSYVGNAYAAKVLTPTIALTSGVAKTVVAVSIPTLSTSSGVLNVSIKAADATDVQVRTQVVRWEAVNKGGSYTTNIAVVSEGVAASTGTLTGSWSIVTGTNSIDVKLTATTSLTPTTFYVTVSGDALPNGSWASS